MKLQTKFSAALVCASMLVGGAASAATLVTINTAGNGVDTSAGAKVFTALGASGVIKSTFSIAASTGAGVAFSEVGTFQVGDFTGGPMANAFGNVASNVDGNSVGGYQVFADISFGGLGAWTANQFDATSGLFSLGLRAVNKITSATINLGTATLSPGPDTTAKVTLVNGTAANTTLSGTFSFVPAAGTTGLGNFFQAPIPFNIGFSVGNFGGNAANTTYVVNGDGSISVFTPGPGLNNATGNLTFVSVVPEPGMLSLAGIALLGVGLASRRKAKAAA